MFLRNTPGVRLIVCALLLLGTGFNISAQQLDHKLGEILISIEAESNPTDILNRLDRSFEQQNGFTATQVTRVPMNIWKVSFDFTIINEIEVLRYTNNIPSVFNAQYNHIIKYRNTPNDPLFSNQWQYINTGQDGGLEGADYDIDQAWDFTTGGVTASGDTIVACIIDDGVEQDHEDFGDNLWINHGEIPDNDIDDDGNGYVDDYFGWNTYNEDDNINVGGGHGTSVAGIVGAKGNNEIGVAGVNWDVKLMIVAGGGDEADALAAYEYPYTMRRKYNESNGEEGAFVVVTNASWGIDYGQPSDAPLWCNFYDSLGMIGIMNVAATSNGNINVDEEGDLPTGCSSEFLITVSNLNSSGAMVGAGYGPISIDLGAFSENAFTLSNGSSYNGFGGTSGASPHVAGTVALAYSLECTDLNDLYQSDPAAASLYIRASILGSVDVIPELNGIYATGGRLNINNAISTIVNNCGACPFPFDVIIEDIFLDTAVVNWVNPEGTETFNLRFKEVSGEDWAVIEGVTQPVVLAGLGICTNYEVQVQSVCEVDSLSSFSFSSNFTTLGCCTAPIAPHFNIAGDMVPDGAILVEWEENPDYNSFILEYKSPEDEDWIVLETEETNLLIEGLGFCNLIDLRLSANCITNVITSYSDTISAVTACGPCTDLDYCNAPDLETAGEWIESVGIDDNIMVTGDNGGYQNNFGLFNVEIPVGREFLLSVDKGFDGASFSEYVKVWIDFNVDGNFGEEDLIFDEMGSSSDNIDTVLLLDQAFEPGYTRMRVGMVFIDEPFACEEDSNASFGEYEDFCVKLFFDMPCDAGLEIDTISIEPTSATVSFTQLDTSIAYNVRYKMVEEPEDAWNTISVLDTMASISPLEECSNYVVQVRAVCPVDTSGFEAVSDTFMTTGANCMVATEDILFSKLNIQAVPNPFSDYINLKVESLNSSDALIEIYNINGQSVFANTQKLISGSNDIYIQEIGDWNAGIYFVRIVSGENQFTEKIIKAIP